MQKTLSFSVFLFLFLFSTISVFSQEQTNLPKGVTGGTTVTVERNEVIDRDYFAAGETVRISGTINGDLYVAGGQVIIDGVVNGDVLAAGGNLLISGEVSDDIRAAGGDITIEGPVGKNVTIAGGNVLFSNTASVSGSLVAGAGSVTINSPIAGNVLLGAGQATITNAIGGDLETGVGQLTVTPDAEIAGDLRYWSEQDAAIAETATVAGTVQRYEPTIREDQQTAEDVRKAGAAFHPVVTVFSAVSFLLVGLLILYFYPNFTGRMTDKLQDTPWVSLLMGFAALILTPIAVILLLVTVLGIPLALILLSVYLISLYLAKLSVIFWAGNYLTEKFSWNSNRYLVFTLGLVVYFILALIPVIGGLTTFFSLVFGLGAMIIASKSYYLETKKMKLA